MKLTHDADIRQASQRLRGFKASAPQVIARVLNREIVRVRTAGVRRIRDGLLLPASDLRKQLRIHNAAANRLQASIRTPARGALLSRFKFSEVIAPTTNPRAKTGQRVVGVRGQIKPGSSYFSSRFFVIQKLKNSGVPGIAIRTGKGRNAVKVLHGPSVSQAFNQIRGELAAGSRQQVANAIQRELSRVARLAGKRP